MRSFSLWLLALWLISAAPALAQRSITPLRANTQVLQQIAVSAEKDYKANRAKALALAKQYGWVIEQTMEDGTFISLQGVDVKGLPIYYITYNNTRAAATTNTDQLWAGGSLGLSLSGASASVASKLAMWDGGKVRLTHQELRGRVQQVDNASELNDHATHVAGTMIGSGVNPQAKGMAHGANLQAYDFQADEAEMAKAAPNLLVSNHSYGSIAGWHYNDTRKGTDEDPYWEWWGDTEISPTEDYRFGYYDSQSARWDKIAYNAPYYLIVKSAGNNRGERGPEVGKPYFQRTSNGEFKLVKARPANLSSNDSYDAISTAGNAKNILSVGAIAPLLDGYTRTEDVRVSSFSSYGPTDDGRIKPDIVGNGVSVLSSSSGSDRDYTSLSGTSMAAPNISGSLLLLQEHYANLNNGAVMRAATLKALAIHTADESGTLPGPDYIYGWGVLNAATAARMITNADGTHLIQEKSLTQGQTQTLEVRASGAGPLRVTISWTDPEGIVVPVGSNALNNRTPRLVNDLDVRVRGNGATYLPWILDPLKPESDAKQGDNVRDNLEQVLVSNAVPGEVYTITVNHKNSLTKGPQAYALLVSGVGGNTACTSAPTSDAGAKITSFGFADKPVAGAANCTTYRNLTNTVFQIEPDQTSKFSLVAGSCGADAPKIAKVFVDWNGDADFDDAGEAVATSGVLLNGATFTGSVKAPATVPVGHVVRMRVVLQETQDAAAVKACGSYTRGETQDYLLRFVQPAKDIAITAVSPVGISLCASSDQKVAVTIRNLGTQTQRDIPITVSVRENGTEIAQLHGVYEHTLQAFGKGELLLAAGFATQAGKTYELVALSGLVNDAIPTNNRLQRTFTVQGDTAPPATASATRCGNSPVLTLTHQEPAGTVFWYNSPTSTQPLAAGTKQQVAASQVNGKLYAAFNDFEGTVGAPDKNFASGGGYNQFSPDVTVTAKAPLVLESARLYIGHGGLITFTVYNENGSPVSSRTLQVTPTRTVPATGAQPNDPADKGAIYYLGLQLPEAGNYNIAISYANDATIFRNNEGVQGYPFEIPNVFAITGNTATTNTLGYYYYFYDLKVSGLGCESPRVEVPIIAGEPLPVPVITREGERLVSSIPNGEHQWYLNGSPIETPMGGTFTPTFSGEYTVAVSYNGCVSETSAPLFFDFESSKNAASADLLVFPNPNDNGRFTMTLETQGKEDIYIEVVDLVGKRLYTNSKKQFSGQYRIPLDLSKHSSGIYILKVQHGDKTETQRLLIRR
ncbi:S8 family serine peptidase [Pontibacter sp. CAU 1760]